MDDVVDAPSFEYRAGTVAEFPYERFMTFLSRLKVQSKDAGLIPFRLLGSQRYILERIREGLKDGVTSFYICKSRQVGCTTLLLAIDMFWAFNFKGLLGTFVLHREEARDDWRQAIDIFYEEIPAKAEIGGVEMKFKPRMMRHNRNILSFSNGSRFRYLIAGTAQERRGGLGRSGASNFVHMSEVAFYGNESDIQAFKSSFSSIYPHRLFVFESTANGFNHFYESYTAAKSSPATRAIFVGWWMDDRNKFEKGSTMYNSYMPVEQLTQLERQRVRDVKRAFDVNIMFEQIAWYRWKFRDDFADDQVMMDEEFPWTDEDSFQATGSQYFTSASLTAGMRLARECPCQGYHYRLGMRWEDTSVHGSPNINRAELRLWEHSSLFGYYVLGCDPAYGSSDTADRSVISVWRCFADRIIQVAEYCTSSASTYQCAWVLAHLAGFYGQKECRCILEITGPGTAVFQELQMLMTRIREIKRDDDRDDLRNVFRHFQHYFYRKPDSPSGGGLPFHWKMTTDLKQRLFAQFKNAFELGRAIVRSVPLIEEMRHIVNDEGYVGAEGSNKDDRVIAACLAYEAWRAWSQAPLRAKGYTQEVAMKIEAAGGEKPLDRLVIDYLKAQQIRVGEPARVRQPWELRR